jgi:hypothetical protein
MPGTLFFKIPKFPLSKKEDLTRTWKNWHNENFHTFLLFIRSIELKRMRWKGHEKYTGNMANKYKILLEKLKGETTWVG